ncbi:carbon-nitrogen hydrolase family protein [Marinobacter orientalis]|uniref:hypothetical protein n=1 Tax=Marinobacter orientalis TaxID=1928859 RepID=UPI001D196B82|nr:hypothetical protein [Marinobacter orientalis]
MSPPFSDQTRRLYNERKNLCQSLELQGVVFAGRLPTLARRLDKFESVEAYVEAIKAKKQRDPVLFTLQLLSIESREGTPAEAMEAVTEYAEPFRNLMRDLALRHNVNIIGGSTPVKEEDGQSCILTPCDFPFARNSGTVRNLKDRRHDLYTVNWRGQ